MSCAHSSKPASTASCAGDLPILVVREVMQPCSSSTATHSEWPLRQALASGKKPPHESRSVGGSTEARILSSRRMTSGLPFSAAKESAVE